MRVSTQLMHRQATDAILDQQSKLARTQQQLGSGERILSPADDPAASTELLGINESLGRNERFQKNIDAARQRLGREEAALDRTGKLLDRVRELGIQGANDTLTAQDREAIAQELDQRVNDLLGLANSQDANSEYLFAGYQGRTQPFARSGGSFIYNGDNGQRHQAIGDNRQVAVSDSGLEVFGAVKNGNGIFQTDANSANKGTGVIGPGSIQDPSAWDGGDYRIQMAHATDATGNLTFNDNGSNDDLTYTLDINGTTVYSVPESGSPVSNLTDLAAEINDDTGTTGVRADVDGGTLYLTPTSPTSQALTITEEISGATPGDGDSLDSYFGNTLRADSEPTITQTLSPSDADGYVVLDSNDNVVTSDDYVPKEQIAFKGIQTAIRGEPHAGDEFTVEPSAHQDIFTMVSAMASALRQDINDPADQAQFRNQIDNALANMEQAQSNINNIRTGVGARLNALDSQEGINSDVTLQLEKTQSQLQDLDYAEAVSRLQRQLLGLQAAQQSFSQVQNLSLFNYL